MAIAEHHGFIEKLCGSIGGVVIGFLLLPVGVCIVFWNEANQVCTNSAYSEAGKVIVDAACTFDSANTNHLVHLSCPVINETANATDPGTGLNVPGALKIVVVTEMYQWKEEGYSLSRNGECNCLTKEWSASLHTLKAPPPGAPSCDPVECGTDTIVTPPQNTSFDGNTSTTGLGIFSSYAPTVELGVETPQFTMTEAQLSKLSGLTETEHNATLPTPDGWEIRGDFFYKPISNASGTTEVEQVGDRRLRITSSTASHVSALGKQGERNGTRELVPFPAGGSVVPPCDKRKVLLFKVGIASADELLDALQSSLGTTTLLIRVLTFLMFFAAFKLIGGPLSVAPDIVPCIGPWVVGVTQCVVSIVAFFCAVSWWSLFTALAYLFYNPLLGVVLLVISALTTWGAITFLRKFQEERSGPLTLADGSSDASYL